MEHVIIFLRGLMITLISFVVVVGLVVLFDQFLTKDIICFLGIIFSVMLIYCVGLEFK